MAVYKTGNHVNVVALNHEVSLQRHGLEPFLEIVQSGMPINILLETPHTPVISQLGRPLSAERFLVLDLAYRKQTGVVYGEHVLETSKLLEECVRGNGNINLIGIDDQELLVRRSNGEVKATELMSEMWRRLGAEVKVRESLGLIAAAILYQGVPDEARNKKIMDNIAVASVSSDLPCISILGAFHANQLLEFGSQIKLNVEILNPQIARNASAEVQIERDALFSARTIFGEVELDRILTSILTLGPNDPRRRIEPKKLVADSFFRNKGYISASISQSHLENISRFLTYQILLQKLVRSFKSDSVGEEDFLEGLASLNSQMLTRKDGDTKTPKMFKEELIKLKRIAREYTNLQ